MDERLIIIMLRKLISRNYTKVLTKDTVGQNVKNAEYAIRGAIAARAEELGEALKKKQKLPFSKILPCNIGNPLSLGQPTFTFDREVISASMNINLLNTNAISVDAKKRAKKFIDSVEYPHALGAYTASPGLPIVRQSVKRYMEERDGYPADINNIFLLNGASDGVTTIFQTLLNQPKDAIMIPIPQYPLYTALISLLNGSAVPYYLDESKGWGLDMADLEMNYRKAKDTGLNVKALVVINPGNPTGQVMTKDNIKDLITFCHENRIIVCADEVYQKNIYCEKPFVSMKKVMYDMGAPYNETELISFHSTSKGVLGECGLRGGYMELVNMDAYAQGQILKLRTITLCPNTVGQLMTEVMVNPPRKGECTDETVKLYNKEWDMIFGGLKSRSKLLTEKLNGIAGITTNKLEGAMYAFPRIHLSEAAIKAAAAKGMAPDAMYCMEALEQTGLILVAGSGFKQREGTYHFRITNLIYNTKEFEGALTTFKAFNEKFFAKYA